MGETAETSLPRIETVSVAIVAYNEESCIGQVLEDVRAQDFPLDCVELLLIDSGSTDGTKDVMRRFEQENARADRPFSRVVVLDNPGKILPAGCNVMLGNFHGDALVRIDAHARIPSDFLSRCVEVLDEGESVCGGPRPTLAHPSTPWSETLLLAEESAFGSSIADYRKGSGNRYVSSAFHAMFRREVIEAVGLYDERLARTEDNDYFHRVREAGYRVRFDERIRSSQIARNTLKRMMRQKYANGFWIGRTLHISPRCISVFHLVPFVFVLALLASLIAGFTWSWLPMLAFISLYLVVDLIVSVVAIASSHKRHFAMVALPALFFAVHFSYGTGTLLGVLRKGAVKSAC